MVVREEKKNSERERKIVRNKETVCERERERGEQCKKKRGGKGRYTKKIFWNYSSAEIC